MPSLPPLPRARRARPPPHRPRRARPRRRRSKATDIRLLVGLGNPGRQYAGTRHNLGFDWIDRLADRWKVELKPWRELATVGEAEVFGRVVRLAAPLTFMNLSGRAVAELLRRNGGGPDSTLVAYDDHAIPLGQLRLRTKGSAGGHNGMKSLIECLGTQEFPRLRMGIGPVPPRMDSAAFVLQKFAPADRGVRDAMVERACDAAEKALEQGFESAMNIFNAVSPS